MYELKRFNVFLIFALVMVFSIALLAQNESDTAWKSDYKQALNFIENQDYNKAETVLQSLLNKNKKLPQAWYGMGLLKRAQGEPDDAIDKFERAIRYDKNYAMAYYQIGMTYKYMENGNLKALDNLKKAVRRDEHLIDAYLEIAKLHVEVEWVGEAIGALEDGIKKNPDNSRLIESLIDISIIYQKYDDCLSIFEKLVKDNPEYYELQLGMAKMEFYQDKFKESLKRLDAMRQNFPDVSQFDINLLSAKNYFQLDRPKIAENYYWTALKALKDSVSINTLFNEVCYLMDNDEYAEYQKTDLFDLFAFYKRFWNKRDPNLSTSNNEFIAEYYDRLDFAHKYFIRYFSQDDIDKMYMVHSTMHPYSQFNIEGDKLLREYCNIVALPRDRQLDDMGVIFMRHGAPDNKVTSGDGIPVYYHPSAAANTVVNGQPYLNEKAELGNQGTSGFGGTQYTSMTEATGVTSSGSGVDGNMITASRHFKVPQPFNGESLASNGFFHNMPMNISWQYYATDDHDVMTFHFKKYTGKSGWIIEAVPYTVANREFLDPIYQRLGEESFNSMQPVASVIQQYTNTIKEESIESVKAALQTESSKYQFAEDPMTVPFTYLSFKGDDGKTETELYYSVDGQNVQLDTTHGLSIIKLANYYNFYDSNWNEVERVNENTILDVQMDMNRWAKSNIVDVERFDLDPATYNYEMQVYDQVSKRRAVFRDTLKIKDYSNNQLEISDILLSAEIGGEGQGEKFKKGEVYYYPHMFNAFSKGQMVGLYFEIYNLLYGQNDQTKYRVTCTIQNIGIDEPPTVLHGLFNTIMRRDKGITGTSFEYQGASRDEPVYVNLDLGNVKPGTYELVVKVEDMNGNVTAKNKVEVTLAGESS